MRIGLVGKPNVGKSSFFQAATLAAAEVGDYPFTTIEPNTGVGYVRVADPGVAKGFEPTPRTGFVRGATRFVPVQIIDVAGLVPGAHDGRGLGNRFLSDAMRADVLIHVVDASGKTDAEGNPIAGGHDPVSDIAFLEEEIHQWMADILGDGWDRVARKAQMEGGKIELVLEEQLSGLGFEHGTILQAIRDAKLAGTKPTAWTPDARLEFCRILQRLGKPILVALNKADGVTAEELTRLQAATNGVPCLAQVELGLKRAEKAGLVAYDPGDATFEIGSGVNELQAKALGVAKDHVERLGGTGVQTLLEHAVFQTLGRLPAFPVADEGKWTDKEGRVLPDCHLVPPGTTALELAEKVHTDLAKHFVRAIDCTTKRVLGKEHVVEAGQVLCIKANA